MNKTVMVRTLKTAFASLFSILIAEELGLDYAAAAGIIAILNVFETRWATVEGGLKRTLSAILALAIGSLCFESFGYNTWVFGLYLLLFVPLSFFLKVELGLGPSSVLVTHLMAFGTVTPSIILNEMALVFIGTGFAMATNFYAPSKQKKLEELIGQVDEKMKDILNLFSRALTEDLDVQLYTDLFKDLDQDLEEAILLAVIEDENMIQDSSMQLYDLHLREREANLLKIIYEDLASIPPSYVEGIHMSEMLRTTSTQLTEKGAMMEVKRRMNYLKDHIEVLDLPKTHEEFKIRAAVYHAFRALDQLVEISNYIVNKSV